MGTLTCVTLPIAFLLPLSASQLINNINQAIVTELRVNYDSGSLGNDSQTVVNRLIEDVITATAQDGPENVQVFLDACSDTKNRSACIAALRKNCPDVKGLVDAAESQSDEMLTLSDVFPLVVYRLQSDVCKSENQQGHGGGQSNKPSSSQAWGYSIGFVATVCVISNIGGLLAPIMNMAYFQRILLFCVALAVGTLGSTGMLVLIPEAMHLTGEDSPVPNYHLKMASVMGGIYLFYVSEKLIKLMIKRQRPKSLDLDMEVSPGAKDAAELLDGKNNGHSHFIEYDTSGEDTSSGQDKSGEGLPPVKRSKEIATVAWMVLIGDSLHNFVDGISIGAAFTENTYLGISVSVAVLCEELPHELGDIAILLNSGMSMKRALLYNFLAAVVCFAGLVVGLVLGENTNANTWVFAVAGGMFVYIALVDMIPEMNEQEHRVVHEGIESMGMTMLIQNIGLVIGFVIIFMIALYGGNIRV